MRGDRISELFFYIRKKLVSRTPRVVSLALTLSEALVKNCGAKAHRAVNDEAFMKTIERVARVKLLRGSDSMPLYKTMLTARCLCDSTIQVYSDRSRKERNREVTEVVEKVLDIVQTWGEAFLPHRVNTNDATGFYYG